MGIRNSLSNLKIHKIRSGKIGQTTLVVMIRIKEPRWITKTLTLTGVIIAGIKKEKVNR
jgi:hypothetical protein